MRNSQETMQSTETSFIERLAHKIGVAASARHIYGDPVERDGVTIITVAKAAYAFGGGSGGNKETEEGSGGGGALALTPVGYIEIKRGETRFRRTRDPFVYAGLIAAIAPLAMLAVRRLTKAFRKENKN